MAIERYLAEARARLGNPSSSKRRASPSQDEALIEFLEEKKAVNESLLAVYNGDAGHERQNDFFESSCASWRIHLPSALGKLERLMIGPFALGDDLVSQISGSPLFVPGRTGRRRNDHHMMFTRSKDTNIASRNFPTATLSCGSRGSSRSAEANPRSLACPRSSTTSKVIG